MPLGDHYRKFLVATGELEPHAQHDLLMACVRSLLQTTALCLFDIAAQRCDDRVRETQLTEIASQRWLDQDSQPREIIRQLLPLVRESRRTPWSTCCERLDSTLEECQKWIEYRNEVSHGVPNGELIRKQIPFLQGLAKALIDGAADVFPHNNCSPYVTANGVPLYSLPKTINEYPVVFRRFGAGVGSDYSVECRGLLVDQHREVQEALRDDAPLARLQRTDFKYRSVPVVSGWCPSVRLPNPRSGFMYRDKELARIQDWWADTTSKNVLLIRADGGYGKTSLVLEFLHRTLKTRQRSPYEPALLCFTSAKRTRFGADGCQEIDPDAANLRSVALHVLEGIDENAAPRKHAQALWQHVAEAGRKRSILPRNVLIVIDNAETLTANADQSTEFANTIDHIAKSIGFRVIVTSRRDERFQNITRVELPRFTAAEAFALARQRAGEPPPVPSILAAEPALRRAVETLHGIPLLIEALVNQLRETPQDIVSTAERLVRADTKGLARFLYEDAWNRLDAPRKNVLFALLHAGPCSSEIVGQFCKHFSITFHEIELNSMNEARFIESNRYPGGFHDMSLGTWADGFVSDQFDDLRPDEQAQFRRSLEEALKDVDAECGALPSRSVPVRNAFRAMQENDATAALEWFSMALQHEPNNFGLAVAFAKFCLRSGNPRRVFDAGVPALLIQNLEGSLLVAAGAASMPETAGDALEKHLAVADGFGADPAERCLIEVQYALTRLGARPARAPSPAPLPKLSNEPDASWRLRQESASARAQREFEEEGDYLRRTAADALQRAQDRLDEIQKNGRWRDLTDLKERCTRLGARVGWLLNDTQSAE